jgi:hypothetical protein
MPAALALDSAPPLSISIQSVVALPLSGAAIPPGPPERGRARLYALLEVQQVKSQAQLVKPVDETRLTSRLVAALDTRGFHLADEQQTPEILLTVHYGRGWLKNPYRSGGGVLAVETSGLLPDYSEAQNTTGVSSQLMNKMSPGYEAESQKASYEKLFVRVTAWAYSTDPNARARRVWYTTMVVDDPDHRDLNEVASEMFAAGAVYFDRATEQNQVSVFIPVPSADAHVKVGTPVVVGEPPVPPGPAPAPAAPAAAAMPARGAALKRFDLPAGEALMTLQAFGRQSGEEIIFPAEQVRAVRTQAISGEFSARAALDRMLDQTGLVAEWDEKSGICIIRSIGR